MTIEKVKTLTWLDQAPEGEWKVYTERDLRKCVEQRRSPQTWLLMQLKEAIRIDRTGDPHFDADRWRSMRASPVIELKAGDYLMVLPIQYDQLDQRKQSLRSYIDAAKQGGNSHEDLSHELEKLEELMAVWHGGRKHTYDFFTAKEVEASLREVPL